MSRAQIKQLHNALCNLLGCEASALLLTKSPEGLVALHLHAHSAKGLTRVGSAQDLLHWAQEYRSARQHPRSIVKDKSRRLVG